MKTAISIPDVEFEAAERLARRLGVSRSELYSRAIAEFVARHCESRVTERLNAVYGSMEEANSLADELQRMQAASIPTERW